MSNGATAQLDTGETISVPLQEGRYRDIVRYTNGSQFYDVVRQLEALLTEYGPTNVTIGNFMYQAVLDAFFRDGREADFSQAPNVLDSLIYLDHTYYQYKTEVDFPGLHIDCDSADKEDLEDMLPYEEPPPLYHVIHNMQGSTLTSNGQVILQPSLDRQELADERIQLQQNNVPQLDGPSEGTKQYISAATSPLQWREYPLNSAGSQVANWDSTGDQLYQTQSSIGDIQHRHIDLERDEPLECRDREHCTNHPISAQGRGSLNAQDIDDLYTDDDTESYDTMDTHMRQPEDFFYCRYNQNINRLHIGAVAQNTLLFGKQSYYRDQNLYAPNNRGSGQGAA